MNYQNYVVGAYAVFVVVLLWDFVVPKLQLRRQLRAVSLRAARESTRATDPSAQSTSRHPGESRDPF